MGGLSDQFYCWHDGLELVLSLVGLWCGDDGHELHHDGDQDLDDDDDGDKNLDVHDDGDDGNNVDECGENGEDIVWLGCGGANGGDDDGGSDGVFVVVEGDVPFCHWDADDVDDGDDDDVE